MTDLSLRGDFSALLRQALAWPARAIETRRACAQLAQMSDRELSDIGQLRADPAERGATLREEDASDRLARARAVRAWYGHAPCKPAA
jgi:uncharacterized protein YjiS (DUF1127 family)